MFLLSISPEGKNDLRELKRDDPDSAALVIAFLQEVQGNQDLLDSLTIHDIQDTAPQTGLDYDVKHWWAYWREGTNLWRIKIMDDDRRLAGKRVIYAYIPQTQHYLVLGIVPRTFNYDPNHELTKRILREYNDLCL